MEVKIRPLIEEDAYTSVTWRNDPEVFKYTGNTYKNRITLEKELEWIKKIISNSDEYRCAILADGVYVGNIYLTGIDNGKAHYHIFIGNKDYWGKGVAKQASKLIIDYAFSQLNIKTIWLRVKINNITAYHLYLKLGFEETSRDAEWITMALIH